MPTPKQRAKPTVLSYYINELRRGRGPRTWAAVESGGETHCIGPTADGARCNIAAQILEKVAAGVRQGRHKPALVISITHAYLHDPTTHPQRPEVVAQVRALRELADELEQEWRITGLDKR